MADPNTGKQNPDEIRREIAETRSNMERNIHALETRLNPDRLKYEATSKVREQTIGRLENVADNATDTVKGTGESMFESIKQNPLPAALAAIGLGWLFMETRNTSRQRSRRGYYGQSRAYYGERYAERSPEYYDYDYDYARQRGGYNPEPMYDMRGQGGQMRGSAGQMAGQAREGMRQAASNVGDTASQVASNVSDTASQVAGNVSDKASQFAGNVSDTASQVASNVSDTASQFAGNVSDTASQFADAAQRSAYQAKTRFQQTMDENPLLIGAAAFALGAAIGMSLPHTEQEDQLFGEARDNLMQKAQEQASQTVDKVQQVAEKAKDAAKEEAQNQKLTTS